MRKIWFRNDATGYTGIALAIVITLLPESTEAACDLNSTIGSDIQICDSGSSGPLTNPGGNNTLIFPVGGTGSIIGNVSFGAGQDHIEMNSGSIVGDFNQGAGVDTFRITAGTITGDVNQSFDPDDFFMSGGTMRSLTQGDGLDTFLMTGGTISTAFEDGDIARMTGGSIGRVDMKLDDNLFDMSGGTIINNLVTGFGRDTIILSGGSIGGVISVSGGDDSITVSGGEVKGGIRASFGNDTFSWRNAGFVRGTVLMADGNDLAFLTQLNETTLGANPLLDGGLGTDLLTFDAVSTSVPARYANWETVNLNNGSLLDLNGEIVLGDTASGTGVLNVDTSSTITSSSGGVRPFSAVQLATLNNAGTLDLSRNGTATDTLTINGNYAGSNGRLLLQSVLGDDSSSSDKLVVSQGSLSGTTQINVTNLGGPGAATAQNGIQVVEANNGATSENTAFSLGNSLSVGAYDYYLFKGGATAGSENSWFLRSTVLAPPLVLAVPNPETPTPVPPGQPSQPTTPTLPASPGTPTPPTTAPLQPAAFAPVAAIGTPPLPAAVAGAAPIPLYRLEVPNYAVVPPAAAVLTLMSLGTFHDRQGEQSLLTESGWAPAGWGRIFGSSVKQSWSGTVDPSLDASLKGYQVGHDLYAAQHDNERIQRAGLFVGHSRLDGDVKGFAGGFQDRKTGKLKLEGDSLGLYWTLTDPKGWYVDAVAMGTRLDGYSRSDRGVRIDTKGRALTLSVEAGYPIPLGADWVIEPQAQLIHQHIKLDSQNDGISDVSFDSQSWNTARLGARLKARYMVSGLPIEPYVRTNLWHNFDGADTVTFNHTDKIKTKHRFSYANAGAGVVATVSPGVSVYLSADYSENMDNQYLSGIAGNLGVRVSW
ncbi:autotransporter outer membrane beta-barrel domain-containing protein [Pseudomonas folii]|uniref:Autotransporter outer membrane beta-barrel domain-containing protein n=1 Tax=Pseudomonas folii TaxID=2762593 RepID=A0ABR7AV38_9PSED|nr:autotransporter outer membrane beta-barrel domain-containing protein [Pseudomonas folii]MBC3948783.1 autotransporter outer membrane beta-barrel domain-containing protein [Pseudomonas folii]